MTIPAPRIGWSPKEIIWLKAALTLSGYDCICALDDIASMSGRTISAVRAKAKELSIGAEIVREARQREREALAVYRRVLVPVRSEPAKPAPMAPIDPIRAPSKQQMMAGKAR